jgi:hypothetical protein
MPPAKETLAGSITVALKRNIADSNRPALRDAEKTVGVSTTNPA